MKKNILTAFSLFSLCVSSTYAQQATIFCGTADSIQQELFKRSDIKQNMEILENFTTDFVKRSKEQRTTQQKIVIPIVFHIIHNNGPENISKDQILDAVKVINTDYHKLNADTSETITQFKNIAANIGIEFRIATIDPNGNCTEGITRTESTQTTNAGEGVKDLVSWDTRKYLNVWVVKSIGSGAGGYAYLPGTAFPASHDGIIIRNDQFGSIGTTPSGCDLCAGSLSHEIGHYFNLNHTWGHTNIPGVASNCSDDDGVADTPNCIGASGCNLYTDNTCGSLANEQNYMDYAGCYTMFTEGQKTRILAAANSTIASRSNLWTNANLVATGTEDGHTVQTCAPIVDFSANKSKLCTGVSVTYSDNSYNGTPTNYNWSFPGGTPNASTVANPVIQYNTAGVYGATLIAGNGTGSQTVTKTNLVRVGQTITPFVYPFEDRFTSANFTDNGWYTDNINGDNVLWSESTTSYNGSAGCVKLNNYNTTTANSGTNDVLVSPPIDFTNITAPRLSFYNAYCNRSTKLNTDAFKISYSLNCGESWSVLSNIRNSALVSTGVSTASFTPTNSSQWTQQIIPITSVAGKNNVIFKFEYDNTTVYGNNLYLDNINFGTPEVTGISSSALVSLNLQIYPNPTEQETTISFDLVKSDLVKIDVVDILGRIVSSLTNEKLDAGNNKILFNSVTERGIYFVKMNIGQEQIIKKLVIN